MTLDKQQRKRALENTRSWDAPVFGLMMRHGWWKELCERSAELDRVSFVELYPENYMRRGAKLWGELEQLAEHYPFTSHGVHLSLGGTDALSDSYLSEVRAFFERFDIPWWSDHIGASIHGDEILHEILPVPANQQTASHIAERIQRSRDRVERPLIVENAATYLVPPESNLSEGELLAEILERSDGELLFDVNNIWVNAQNLGFSVSDALDCIPMERVREIHVGGFTVDSELGLFIDSHAAAPSMPVWRLLTETLKRTGPKPVLIEWESHYQNLDSVLSQLDHALAAWNRAAEASSERGAAQ